MRFVKMFKLTIDWFGMTNAYFIYLHIKHVQNSTLEKSHTGLGSDGIIINYSMYAKTFV